MAFNYKISWKCINYCNNSSKEIEVTPAEDLSSIELACDEKYADEGDIV